MLFFSKKVYKNSDHMVIFRARRMVHAETFHFVKTSKQVICVLFLFRYLFLSQVLLLTSSHCMNISDRQSAFVYPVSSSRAKKREAVCRK